jgi:hypothetical protein
LSDLINILIDPDPSRRAPASPPVIESVRVINASAARASGA